MPYFRAELATRCPNNTYAGVTKSVRAAALTLARSVYDKPTVGRGAQVVILDDPHSIPELGGLILLERDMFIVDFYPVAIPFDGFWSLE